MSSTVYSSQCTVPAECLPLVLSICGQPPTPLSLLTLVQCRLHCTLWKLYSLHCTVYIILCIVYTVHCTLQCPLHSSSSQWHPVLSVNTLCSLNFPLLFICLVYSFRSYLSKVYFSSVNKISFYSILSKIYPKICIFRGENKNKF